MKNLVKQKINRSNNKAKENLEILKILKTCATRQDPDENVPEAQHTTDDVEDVIIVVRDEYDAEILQKNCLNFDDNFHLLTLEQLEAGIHL